MVLMVLTFIGKLVLVAAISVAMEDTGPSVHDPNELLEYLEEIVKGSHPSLGEPDRQLLRDLLLRYRHVFPAPGEPVTGRTSTLQHDILTTDTRPVRCGPRRLAQAGLRKEQTSVREMLEGGQIEPSDSPWASREERRINALLRRLSQIECPYDEGRISAATDSLRLLGNQQWFSTMDLASGYWQVTMSPEAKSKAVFVTNEGIFQFRIMPFGLCNAPATFERLMDRVLCGMRWSRCLVYLDDVISFDGSVTEALACL